MLFVEPEFRFEQFTGLVSSQIIQSNNEAVALPD